MRMNVLALMNYAANYEGGFLRFIKSIEKKLQKDGGEMIYLLPERARERDWVIEKQLLNTPIYFYNENMITLWLLIKKIIKKHNINIIHSHFITYKRYIPIKLARIGKNKNIPHIVHAHSEPKRENRAFFDFIRHKLIDEKLIICVSKTVEKEYKKRGHNCVTVLNGLDFDEYDKYEILDRKAFGIDEKKTAVLMLGYDFYIKGVDTALKSFSKFNENNEFVLLLCYANELEKAEISVKDILGDIPDFLRILPPRNDFSSYLKLADIFLSASRTEGFQYTIAEAAYLKMPLVASKIPINAEHNIPNALTFQCENEAELFTAVKMARDLIGSDKLNAAKEFVIKNYSLEKCSNEIIKIYKSIVN